MDVADPLLLSLFLLSLHRDVKRFLLLLHSEDDAEYLAIIVDSEHDDYYGEAREVKVLLINSSI